MLVRSLLRGSEGLGLGMCCECGGVWGRDVELVERLCCWVVVVYEYKGCDQIGS